MKQNFIERNFFAVFKTLQVVYIILACIEAFNDGQLELTYRPFSASSFESSYNEDGSHNENY